MAMLARLKEDLLLCADWDDDRESASGPNENTNMAEKSTSHPDSGLKDDILESLTQVFVHTKEKSPVIAEKIAGLFDNVATGGLSPNTVKDELRNVLVHKIVNSCPPPQLTKRFGICCQDAAEWLTFPVGASATCWGLSALSILGDQLVKDLYSGKTTNKQQILDHMMDSIALLASANFLF